MRAAVSGTALAGCGRGRDGQGCQEWRGWFTRAPRVRHGRGTMRPRKCAADGSYAWCRTVRNLRGCLLRHGRSFQPRKVPALRCSLSAHTSVFEHRRDAVFLGSVWPNFRTPQGLRGSKCAYRAHFEPRSFLTVRIPPSLAQDGHGSPTSCRPCAGSPTNPSRPGRLIAVAACQDRDETPRTHLGRAGRPGARASRYPLPLTAARSAASSRPGRACPSPPARAAPACGASRRRIRSGSRRRRSPGGRGR